MDALLKRNATLNRIMAECRVADARPGPRFVNIEPPSDDYTRHPITTYLSTEERETVDRLMAATSTDTVANLLRASLYALALQVWGKSVDTALFELQTERSQARRKKARGK